MKSEYRTWLAISADEKEAAQQAHPPLDDGRPALVWHGEHKLWYARPGTELDRLAQWLPRPQEFSAGQSDPVSEFALTLEKAGLVLKGLPVMDGTLQRVPTRDDRRDGKSGAYRAWMDGRPAGWYRDYRSGEAKPTNWVFSGGEEADPRTRLHLRAQAQQNRDDSLRHREQQYRRQADYASRVLGRLRQATEHPYLTRKGIHAAPGIRINDRQELVVPLSNIRGEIRSFQRIPESGGKDARLLKEAEKAGNFFAFGDYRSGAPVLFAEGYATAATLHEATGLPVLMTVDAANMVDVALNVREALPATPLVFCADNDAHLPVNKGVTSAQQAAILAFGQYIVPEFSPEETAQGLTDFNDLAVVRGHEVFTRTLHDMLRTADITFPADPITEVHTMDTESRDDEPYRAADTPEFPPGPPVDSPAPAERLPGWDTMTPADVQDIATPEQGPPVIPEFLFSEPLQPVGSPEPASTADATSSPEAQPVDTAPAVSETLQPVDSPEPVSTADATSSPRVQPSDTAPAVSEPLQPVDTPEPASTADATSSPEVQPVDTAPAVSEPLQPVDSPEPASTADATSSPEVQPVDTAPAVNESLQPVDSPEPVSTADATSSPEVQPVDTAPAVNESLQQADTPEPASTADATSSPEAQPVDTAPGKARNTADDNADMAEAEAVPRQPQPTAGDPLSPGEDAAAPASSPPPDAIVYGPRRPEATERADLDAIVRQLKWDVLPDNTVLYRLDDQPAFRDLGNRLEMADGASADDKKILAALAVAAKFYGGVIELTGSEAFRERAMHLIVTNDINVRMKQPAQRARLDALRQTHASTGDAVKTHIPTPDMFAANTPGETPPVTTSAARPSAAAPAARTETAAGTAPEPSAPASSAAPAPSSSPQPQPPAEELSPPPKLSPGQSVTAELTRYGEAEYGQGKGRSFFIELSNRDGSQRYWGRELEALVKNIRTGEAVTLTLNNRESFTLPGEDKPRVRNHWSLTPLTPGIAVSHDRPEQGMTVEAYDRASFNAVMEKVVAAWPDETRGLKVPQGFTGDLLLGEDRHPVSRPDRLTGPVHGAGEAPKGFAPVMGAVNDQTRETDLLLVQGAGDHLQGVVRLNGTLYPALATPTVDGSQLVINAVTETGLRFAGYGEAINRHRDNPNPSPEHMVFTLKQREAPLIAQLYTPDKQPDALFRRLGFEQTWQQWSASPKPEDRQEKHHHQALSHNPGR
ncbi:LPD7 domain-containing protein [Klebsiella sp. PL-2018]|uniref:LPD7 domain-containing protein n=1 Tax=Klebsiella sp. PL-2018 TaxID=2851540 RepID=UPI001C23C42A|nr:LPD7 domain-containing protein [Klebsiella sp. PL-2018]QXD00987.1 IncI1 plasmid conjugative transfer DNA primase [Klebsiella sp. PL-2018]